MPQKSIFNKKIPPCWKTASEASARNRRCLERGSGEFSVLLIFGKNLPQKSKKWWQQFDKVLNRQELAELTNPGSIVEAHEFVNKISRLTLADGRSLPKLINYQDYELWWINYNSIYHNFCLPYTQYRNLLQYLKDFDRVYLFEPPRPHLFQYFLKSHRCQCIIFRKFRLRNFLPIPFGVFIQLLLSVAFLPWLMIIRPRLMIRISDKFNPPHDYDFRKKFIYEELRKRKLPFVEFIRSLEGWRVVLSHAWERKRPVFYSTAVIEVLQFLTGRLNQPLPSFSGSDPEQNFWFLVGTHYLRNVKGTILSIRALRLILQWVGVKAAHISVGSDRTFHEVLACKMQGIKTVGIMHGAVSQYYDVYDFVSGFDGNLPFSVDRYGLWSEWWRDYYIKNSHAYSKDQLFVSGPMRPLEKEIPEVAPPVGGTTSKKCLKVLFISEDLAAPQQIIPYLLTLLEVKDFDLYFKFRPYRDSFELQLKKNYPEVYKKIFKNTKILRGTIEEAVLQCDVVTGSYSTAVLETLLQLKPPIFFWTDKWKDNFEMKSLDARSHFFAENPKDLIDRIRESINIPKEDLKRLREQFFGNPYQNGSKWVVEQLIKHAYASQS